MEKHQKNSSIKKIATVISVAAFSALTLFFYGHQDTSGTKGNMEVKSLEYTCPMHLDYVSEAVGDCPICGMDLVGKVTTQKLGVKLSKKQADEITLTKTKVSVERIEKWIRTAGSRDPDTKQIRGKVYGKDAALIKPGQQVRAFPLVGRDPVLQGKVTGLVFRQGVTVVKTDISDPWYQEQADYYIMEIIVDLGTYPSIANEAIIEENDGSVVYVAGGEGQYFPVTISTGRRGELYTQIVDGIQAGDEVVTFGSFFLDAQYKIQKK